MSVLLCHCEGRKPCGNPYIKQQSSLLNWIAAVVSLPRNDNVDPNMSSPVIASHDSGVVIHISAGICSGVRV